MTHSHSGVHAQLDALLSADPQAMFADVELYTQLLSGVSGTIFEPAAGNGRALIPLALRGYKVNRPFTMKL